MSSFFAKKLKNTDGKIRKNFNVKDSLKGPGNRKKYWI